MRIIACLMLAVLALGAIGPLQAAEPMRRGKIAAPDQMAGRQPTYAVPVPDPLPPAPEYKAHTLYVGGAAGALWGLQELPAEYGTALDGTTTTTGAIFAGWLWRNDRIGAGVELDYAFRDLGDFRLEDATASVRGRLGLFVAPGTFVYGTAGIAEAMADTPLSDDLRRGLVVGGGVEKDVTGGLAVRAEVLHYRHAGDYFEWGEEGSTAARVGLLVKF